MKIPVFYAETNRIVFLDNNLSRVGDEINLENYEIYGKALICGNEIGGLWVTNITEKSLLKFDSSFKLIFKKNLFEPSGEIIFTKAQNRLLFLQTDKKDIYVFDENGYFIQKIPQKIQSDFQIEGNYLKYVDTEKKSFVVYDFKEDTLSQFFFPDDINPVYAADSPHYLFITDKKYICRAKNPVNQAKNK
jgi:hypothetical protein